MMLLDGRGTTRHTNTILISTIQLALSLLITLIPASSQWCLSSQLWKAPPP
jgi:hypothetical protein